MAKPSAYVKRTQAAANVKAEMQRRHALQQAQDIAVLTLHEEFGFGEDRIHRFCMVFGAMFEQYAKLVIEDSRADKEIVYAKAKVDELMKEACGEHFEPWDKRYEWCNKF